MPPLANAETLRTHFQYHETGAPAEALLARAVEAAETVILPRLAAEPPDPVPPALALGATLLAGTALLRALAAHKTNEGAVLTLGGQRLDGTRRFPALMARAAKAEAEAWDVLAPYLAPVPTRSPVAVTPSVPLFGDPT